MNDIPRTQRYLTMVTQNNNNKFYMMTPLSDGTWQATWGRIGASKSSCIFQAWQWDSKYAEKIHKGYTDISDVYFSKDEQQEKPEGASHQKTSVGKALMQMLSDLAHRFVRGNYDIDESHITQSMVQSGRRILDEMVNTSNIDEFNDLLSRLFRTIPRRMQDTRFAFARTSDDLERIRRREATMLDSISGMARTTETGDDDSALVIEEATEREISAIKAKMGSDCNMCRRIWRVTNPTTEAKFDIYKGKRDTKLLWHGSRSENFRSILLNGLLLNPQAPVTGKMFGYGLYFAPSFLKSLGYTSLRGSYWAGGSASTGFLALFEVATGKSYDVHSYSGKLGTFHQKDITDRGCDSLYAHRGDMLRNDEIVVYREDACTIRYLVEVSR